MFVCEDPVTVDRANQPKSTMNMTLRPGEALVWRWGHLTPAKYSWRSSEQPDYPDTVCDGLWEYRPDFSNDLWRKGATTIENIVSGPDGLRSEEGKTGTIIWTMRSPYIFVGGASRWKAKVLCWKSPRTARSGLIREKKWSTGSSRTGDRNASTINSAVGSPTPPGSSCAPCSTPWNAWWAPTAPNVTASGRTLASPSPSCATTRPPGCALPPR